MKEKISFLNEDETFENTFEIHFTEKYNDIKCLPDSSSLNLLIMPTREASPMDDGSMITTMAYFSLVYEASSYALTGRAKKSRSCVSS